MGRSISSNLGMGIVSIILVCTGDISMARIGINIVLSIRPSLPWRTNRKSWHLRGISRRMDKVDGLCGISMGVWL